MNDLKENSQPSSFIDPRIYRKCRFSLRFNKIKIEKAYVLERFAQNLFIFKCLIIILGLLTLFKFSPDPNVFLTFQGFSSDLFSLSNLLIYICIGALFYLLKRNKKPSILIVIMMRFLLEIICITIKQKIITYYDRKSSLISIMGLNILSNSLSIPTFYLNVGIILFSNTFIVYMNSLGFYDWFYFFILSSVISYIVDLNARKNWIVIDIHKKGYNVFMYLYGNSINPHFIIDQEKKILSMNIRAQEIFEFSNYPADPELNDFQMPQIKRNPNKAYSKSCNFLKLLKPTVRDHFEEQLLKAKEFAASAFSLELVLPRKYSGREDLKTRYTEAEGNLLEEIMGNDSIFEEFSEETGLGESSNKSMQRKVDSQSKDMNFFIDINGNGPTNKLMEGSELALEMLFNSNIKPILWASKPCFLLEFKDILNEKNIILRTLSSYDEIHDRLLDILTCLENDYIKWNNLQGNAQGSILIKDGDLKNLANGIYMINSLLNRLCVKREIVSCYLGNPVKLQKKFHVQNTLIYLIEVVYLKVIDKLWEVNLSFEESFPDFVNGDYFRFKTVILIFLKIVFNYTNFPKHSKFKIHCKLKEIMNIDHEGGKYLLVFDFDLPRFQKQIDLFQLLINRPLFTDISKLKPLFVHPKNSKTNKQEFLVFKPILDLLSCKNYISDQDPNRYMISFEMPFNIVQLDTILGSNRIDDTNSSNIHHNYSPSRSTFNHKLLNLTFLRSQLKKNNFVWKPKQKKQEKNIHPAPAIMKTPSKDIKKEANYNIPSNQIDVKKPDDITNDSLSEDLQQVLPSQPQQIKIKSQDSFNKLDEPPAPIQSQNSRKSFKRRESKLNSNSKTSSIAKLEGPEEFKNDFFQENDNALNIDHRKSHFSINQAMDEVNMNMKQTSNSLFKMKSREIASFPTFLNYKLSELKLEKTKILKQMLMKDTLILLKQQTTNQHKKIDTMFKSEVYIPKIDGESKEICFNSNNESGSKENLKYNTFSTVEELRKFDYDGYRSYILNKNSYNLLPNPNNLDFFKKIDLKNGLSQELKPAFCSLFSSRRQRNYSSLMR